MQFSAAFSLSPVTESTGVRPVLHREGRALALPSLKAWLGATLCIDRVQNAGKLMKRATPGHCRKLLDALGSVDGRKSSRLSFPLCSFTETAMPSEHAGGHADKVGRCAAAVAAIKVSSAASRTLWPKVDTRCEASKGGHCQSNTFS